MIILNNKQLISSGNSNPPPGLPSGLRHVPLHEADPLQAPLQPGAARDTTTTTTTTNNNNNKSNN